MRCRAQSPVPGCMPLAVPVILFCLTLHAAHLPDELESDQTDVSQDDVVLLQLEKAFVRTARSRNTHRSSKGNGNSEYEINLAGYSKSSGLVDLYTDPRNSQDLVVDVTDLVLNKPGASLRITASAAKGTYIDGWGFQALLHEPLEEEYSPLYQLELSMDESTVHVLQPQFTLRSSDPKTQNTFNAETSNGMLIGEVHRLQTSLPNNRIVIDGIELVQYGFFVSPRLTSTITSYEITHVKSYKTNFDVTVRFLDVYALERVVTFSLVLLPETPMPARVNDDRLMYFTVDYQDMGVHTQDYSKEMSADDIDKEIDPQVSVIWRYDLTKGPIRIHVDPSVPQEWRSSFKKGIEDWNDAFELAGHPGAIKAVLPGDADWPADYDAGDALLSTITWALNLPDVFSEAIAKVDPRSGEVIKGDVLFTQGWVLSWLTELEVYDLHQTQKLSKGYRHERRVRQDGHSRPQQTTPEPRILNKSAILDERPILLQESAVAGQMQRPEDFKQQGRAALLDLGVPERSWYQAMQAGLADVVRHEVGHLLGLRHNFKGSVGISSECTQNKTCSSLHGLTTSVMDYLPTNIPSMGSRDVHLFSPVVGAYDKLAIRYGYTDVNSSEQHNGIPIVPPELKNILSEAEAIPFCTDEDLHTNGDPECEVYDLTADPLGYWEDQILLLKKLTESLLDRAVAPGESYSHFGARVSSFLRKGFSIQSSLFPWLGGINVSRAHRPSAGSKISRPPLQAIPVKQQRKALTMMLELLEPEKAGILPPMNTLSLMSEKTSDSFHRLHLFPTIRHNQQAVLHALLNSQSLIEMDEAKDLHGLSVKVLLSDVLVHIIGDSDGTQLMSSTPQDWDLQMDFIDSLLQKREVGELPEELELDIAGAIRRLKNTVEESLSKVGNNASTSEQLQTHLMTVNHKLHEAAKDMGFLIDNSGAVALALFWLWPLLMVRVLAAC